MSRKPHRLCPASPQVRGLVGSCVRCLSDRRPKTLRPASVLAALVGFFACAVALAAPHVPASDSTVLEQVPAADATKVLAPLRERLVSHPEDLSNALALARGYLDIGRANSDPRFVSYAQATLTPWLARPQPNPAVLTLAASALQYLHRFDDALRLLDRALASDPSNAQAWLTKATILQVQGRFTESREACRPLARLSGQMIALACLSSVNSLTGRLSGSYAALRTLFVEDSRLDPGVRVWLLDQLADMAQRVGDEAAAEQYLQAALRAAPGDAYSKAALADLWLLEGRESDVMRLLRSDEQQDNLLLRLAIAGTRLAAPEGVRWSRLFQERYEAARRDGDYTHLREQARFVLEVRRKPTEALDLARRNWASQHEPADVRVYLAAARSAADRAALANILAWARQTGYEDRTCQLTMDDSRSVVNR